MLSDFLVLLVRRWLLTSLSFIAGLAAAVGAVLLVAPVQRSEAAVLFIPPSRDATVNGTINPFLSLGGAMGVVPSVVQNTVTDDQTVNQLKATGFESHYLVNVDIGQNAAPILRVQVDSTSAGKSMATARAVVERIQSQLLTLQQDRDVDPKYYISSQVLTSTPTPLVVHTRQIQVAAVAGIAVIIAGLATVGFLSRSRRRVGPAEAVDVGTATVTTSLAATTSSAAASSPVRIGLTAVPGSAGATRPQPAAAPARTAPVDPVEHRGHAEPPSPAGSGPTEGSRVLELVSSAVAPNVAPPPATARRRGRRTTGPASRVSPPSSHPADTGRDANGIGPTNDTDATNPTAGSAGAVAASGNGPVGRSNGNDRAANRVAAVTRGNRGDRSS